MGGETLTPQRGLPNMKTIPSKLWSVASGNQTVFGGGGGDGGGRRDQNQSIPNSSGDTIKQLVNKCKANYKSKISMSNNPRHMWQGICRSCISDISVYQ
jgi:hypothetical protein